MRKIEQLLRRVTKWVLPWKSDYRERLLLLNLLPIPMYIQVLDVLTLVKMCNGCYDIDPQFTFKLGRASSRDCRIIPHIKYPSTELQYQEFFVRTCRLIKHLPAVDVTQPLGLKPKLLSIFWTFFMKTIQRLTSALGAIHVDAPYVLPDFCQRDIESPQLFVVNSYYFYYYRVLSFNIEN